MIDKSRICAEKRAADAANDIDRLLAENAQLAEKARRFERAANELLDSHLAALETISKGIFRENAMRAEIARLGDKLCAERIASSKAIAELEPGSAHQKNGGSSMNSSESRDRRGRLALEAAITAFDQKLYGTAHTWAEVAAETIKACNLTPAEQRLLVAPRVELSRGDKAAGVFCGLVVAIVLFAALFDPAKELIAGWLQ